MLRHIFNATVEGQTVTIDGTNPIKEKYQAFVILLQPSRTDAVSSADPPVPQSLPSAPQRDNMIPSSSTLVVRTSSIPFSPGIRQGAYADPSAASSRLSTVRGASPVMPDPGLSPSVNNNLSLLYHDQIKREARRNSSTGDIYVDVNREAYLRLMQGERIQLVFEESGTYRTSPFILVENCSQLYINFYQFNEGKNIPLEKEKILSHIFEIRGELPGCIKECEPAQMVPQTGGYVIKNKGLLVLEGAV